MSIQSDAFDLVLQKLARSYLELKNTLAECQDIEIKESKPRSEWLALADSICHEPYRRPK